MLSNVSTTKITRPPVMVVYGDHKIGKSTFGAGCPNPVFVQTEDGLESLGVDAFPLCKRFEDVLKQLEELRVEKHEYKTLVLDSLDWTEKLIWSEICLAKNWDQLGDGPYGAGYKLALNRWRDLIAAFTRLNSEKKMMIVLIAHAKIMKFEDPERDNYDRWDLDLHEKAGNLVCQYCDIIGFANYRIVTQSTQEGFGKTTKGKSTGERILNLSNKAAFEAGNRFGLPDQIALSWDALVAELKKKKPKPVGNLLDVKKEQQVKTLEKILKVETLEKIAGENK